MKIVFFLREPDLDIAGEKFGGEKFVFNKNTSFVFRRKPNCTVSGLNILCGLSPV